MWHHFLKRHQNLFLKIIIDFLFAVIVIVILII